MKLHFVFSLLLLNLPFLQAQNLSQEQAIQFAQQLHEVEILSQKGVERLAQKIRENDFRRDMRTNPNTRSTPVKTELSVSHILTWLNRAFMADFYYRSGLLERQRINSHLIDLKQTKNLSDEEIQVIAEEMIEELNDFAGWKIEEAIPDEDHFPKTPSTFILGMHLAQETGTEVIHHKRSVVGKTCERTLSDIHKIGLIDTVVYQEIAPNIRNLELFSEARLLDYVAQRVVFYEDFIENKSEELKFLDNLHHHQLIDSTSLNALLNSYQEYELKEKFDFLAYCNNAKIFPLNNYSSDPTTGYREIFEDITTIIPEFKFQNFSAELIETAEDSNNDLIQQNLTIDFEIDGITYKNNFYYHFRKNQEGQEEIGEKLLKINIDFHNGINKWLADQNSELRLYFANRPGKYQAYSHQEFGLILMTETQYKAWASSVGDFFLFQESYDNSFNTQGIKQAITDYEALGLFDHLTQEEIAKGKQLVDESEIKQYNEILTCFPKLIVFFDWETGNLDNPYEELTLAFAEASRGTFNPQNIVDKFRESWGQETVEYSFEINGKKYQKQLTVQSDWLDPGFMELIGTALQKNNAGTKIYFCIDVGQAAGYIFLSQSQHDFLKEHQPSLFPKW